MGRRTWTRFEENALLDVLEDLAARGYRKENGNFSQGALVIAEQGLSVSFPNSELKASPHIESKMKTLKNQYALIFDMLNTSGFAWNDVRKCVEVDSDDTWNTYVQHHIGAEKWRGKYFPIYERLAKIFGADRATGKAYEVPADMVEEGEEDENDIEVERESSRTSAGINQHSHTENARRKRARTGDRFSASVDKFTNSMTHIMERMIESNEKQMTMIVDSLKEDKENYSIALRDELEAMGLSVSDRIRALNAFAEKPKKVNVFKALKTIDEKKAYIADLIDDM